jgi:inosine/xanthosine triphosphatase
MIRIVVGSKSDLKVRAVQHAIDRIGLEAEVVGVQTSSGVPEQPYGREQTVEGATNRARAAYDSGTGGCYAVGIENGIVPAVSHEHALDLAYIVIIDPSGRRIVRKSIGVVVPTDLVEASLASKQTQTAGALEAMRSGCDPADPHRVWSKGATDRETILANALYNALLSATINEEGALS